MLSIKMGNYCKGRERKEKVREIGKRVVYSHEQTVRVIEKSERMKSISDWDAIPEFKIFPAGIIITSILGFIIALKGNYNINN